MPTHKSKKEDRRRGRTPGQRAGLTVEAIVAEARSVSEVEGVERLTMRRVATGLGVAPNALYSHFADKSALLDALLDSLLVELDVPVGDDVPWRDGLIDLMQSTRRFLLAHADLLPHFLSRPTRGPNAIRLGEATLNLLSHAGLEGEEAADALQILLSYTFGFAAQESPRLRNPQPDEQRATTEKLFGADPDRPLMSGLANRLARYPADVIFDEGLRWLLEGIDTRRTLSGEQQPRVEGA